ncbi:MAG: hypothetical protein OEV08_01600 [Nitrospira sp.]|nr:hypothetical protein [Nitrospira sp.]
MKKLLLGIALLLLIGLAGGVWWLYSSLDSQVASAIRTYGPKITGVPVSLTSVHIDLADGSAALRGLVVGNPPNFKTNHALSLGEISMKLDIGSLTKDVIRIKEISILKPSVTYEYALGGSNLDIIQRNIDTYVASHVGGKSAAKRTEPGKKLVIEHVYIKNGVATVGAETLNVKTTSVPLSELHLKDIGKKSNGATAGEAVKQILGALAQRATASVGSQSLGTVGNRLKGLFK